MVFIRILSNSNISLKIITLFLNFLSSILFKLLIHQLTARQDNQIIVTHNYT